MIATTQRVTADSSMIVMDGKDNLLDLILALSPSCGFARRQHRWQDKCNDEANDRQRDQQFDEREAHRPRLPTWRSGDGVKNWHSYVPYVRR